MTRKTPPPDMAELEYDRHDGGTRWLVLAIMTMLIAAVMTVAFAVDYFLGVV